MTTDLPAPGSIAREIDIGARLRVFDFDGSLATAAREEWEVIEPEVTAGSEAYWQQWMRCFGDRRTWAPAEARQMVDLGSAFLRHRFLDTVGRAWIEAIGRHSLCRWRQQDRAAVNDQRQRPSGAGRADAPHAA